MLHRARLSVICVVVASALGAWLLPGIANADLVNNGGFETGSLSGWTEQDQAGSSGSWLAYSGTVAPLSGNPIPAPPQGTYAAISDQTDPSSSILYQDVTLPAGGHYTLALYAYYTAYAALDTLPTLDYTTTGNEQFRIDIMSPTAAPTSVAAGDVLKSIFVTQSGGADTMAPTLLTADLSQFAGQTVRLRVAVVANESFLNAGVDGVSITSPPTAATLPASGATLTGAMLNGAVNPLSEPTTYEFQYGTTSAYGSSTAAQTAGTDTALHAESAAITGLKPGTTYHYRIVAASASGVTPGPDQTFTTVPVTKISNASESHHKWRASSKGATIAKKAPPVGTAFKFTLNVPAKVTLTFAQPGHGRKVNGRCLAIRPRNAHNSKCAVVRGTLSFNGRAGKDTVRFYGRLAGKKLKPGSYTVTISAKTPGFGTSSKTLSFKIVS